jgi:UDP-glucose 4-epimerase
MVPVFTPAAVVGAAGFIGAELAGTLAAAAIPVERVTRDTPVLSAGRLTAPIARARVIFYLATSINPAIAELHPERVAADHESFTRFIDALRRGGHRPGLVLASTAGAIYDPRTPPPYAEEAPAGPTSAYGRAKLELEKTLLGAQDAVSPVVLRIANAYGEGQRVGTGQGVIGHWLQAAAAGHPIKIYGDPLLRRDYVHVRDVVSAMRRLYDRFAGGGVGGPLVLNVASGRPVSLGELLGIVRAAVGREVAVEALPGRAFDRRDVWFDITMIRKVLGWRPRIGLEEGVRAAWQATRPRPARADGAIEDAVACGTMPLLSTHAGTTCPPP